MKSQVDRLLNLNFLGPKGEQRAFLQEILQLLLNDYVFWRRNFYPKDPPAISYGEFQDAQAHKYKEKFMQELFTLISDLKLDVPFFSPRYLAHMTSEISMPALVSYIATLLYNPNNVSSEAAAVTMNYEIEVGKQFAHLFGYDKEKAFGHLTSGGTVANYESLFYNRVAKFLPATMGLVLIKENLPWIQAWPKDLWQLLNIPMDQIESYVEAFQLHVSTLKKDPAELYLKYSIANLGTQDLLDELQEAFEDDSLGKITVLVPETAHYGWKRSAHLFGIGKKNFEVVKVDDQFEIIPEDLKKVLERCHKERKIVLQLVCVFGSTEFGSIDPVFEVAEVIKEMSSKISCPLHIDAAYGGYFATMFHTGSTMPELSLTAKETYPHLFKAYEGLKFSDSITVDPHKMGHCPYGAGAFITKHSFLKNFVAESAHYCFSSPNETVEELGKFILEGSKPGAAASAVYFSHKLMPLDSDGFGAQAMELCRLTQEFEKKLNDNFHKKSDVTIVPVHKPASNILCFFARSKNLKKLSQINDLTKHLGSVFGKKDVTSVQYYRYIVSHTVISTKGRESILGDIEYDEQDIYLIRTVFMNRWVKESTQKGITYLDDFINELINESVLFIEN